MREYWSWVPVAGYEGYYEVSELGFVRSLTRRSDVPPHRLIEGRILEPIQDEKGYLSVALYRDGVRKFHKIHRLVLRSFVGGETPDLQACHRNGVRNDNRLVNLHWGTNSENQLESVRHGTHRSARVDECPKGHVYDEENTYRPKNGQRACKECNRIAAREYQRRRRAALKERMNG